MKFQLTIQEHNTGMRLEGIPDDMFDGQPKINQLIFDSVLANPSADHIAVAAALVFGEFVGHDFYSGSPISRLAAEAIQDYLSGRRVSVQKLTDVARSSWPSAGVLKVDRFSHLPVFETTKAGEVHGHQLYFADGRMFNGAIGSPHQSIVASNLDVFSTVNQIELTNIIVALGVLFSRDLHMRTIEVQRQALSEREARNIADLVRAVDLNVRFV